MDVARAGPRLYRSDVDLHFRSFYEEFELLWKSRRDAELSGRGRWAPPPMWGRYGAVGAISLFPKKSVWI